MSSINATNSYVKPVDYIMLHDLRIEIASVPHWNQENPMLVQSVHMIDVK